MLDFIVALGLSLVIEGLMFAAFPAATKKAIEVVQQTPETTLRIIGVVSALAGLLVVWCVRG
jgi:uncharacterized protein YjeT (DUF2065 family)